jgi:phasin family protein
MATRSPPKSAARKPAAKKAKPRAKAAAKPKATPKAATFKMPGGSPFVDMSKMPGVLTPEQAIELYKTNARLALDIINAAIDGTAKVRRMQFEGEEQARAFHKRAAKTASEARDPQSFMAAGQGVAQEAVEKSMHYWGEMFGLIVEIQKRLFSLIEEQAEGVPGVKQAKAAMAMMPDLTKMQNVVSAMQGVLSSGGPAFESMQKVMSDFTRMAQQSMPGMKR